MGVYIKNWSLADWKELLKWAKLGANNAMIGEFSEVEEVPPHGRLIDADVLKVYMLNEHYNYREVVSYSDIVVAPTIIPPSEEATP